MSVVLTPFEVTADHPVPISPQGGTATVTVLSGDTLYYADTPQVSAAHNQGSVTAGNVQSFTNPAWVRSASLSTVLAQVTAPAAAVTTGSPQVQMASSYLIPSGGDDSAAMASALTNFAPFAYPVVMLGPGTFQWSSQVPGLLRNTPATIQGAGESKTNVRLSTTAPRFLDFAKVADYDTFSDIEISDLTVDCNNVGGKHHVVIGTYAGGGQMTRISVNRLSLRRIRTINVPSDSTTTNHRLNVWVVPAVNTADTPCTLNDHVYEDLDFMQGGNMGLVVGGSAAAGTSALTWDRITILRVKHDTTVTFNGMASSFSSSNIQVGSRAPGGTAVIEGCYGANSGDVGIEVDNHSHLDMRSNVIQDSYTAEYLFRTFAAPIDGAQKSKAIVDTCDARVVNQVLAEANVGQSTGFYMGNASDLQAGRFTFRDCMYVNKTANLVFGANGVESVAAAMHSVGPILGITLERFRVVAENLAMTPADNQQPRVIALNQTGATTTRIKGLYIRLAGTNVNAGGTNSLRTLAPSPTVGGDVMNIQVEDYDLDNSVTGLNSGYGLLPGFKGGTIRGTVRQMRILADASANTVGVLFNTSPLISPKVLIADCDFTLLASNNEFSIPVAQASKIYLEHIIWKSYPKPSQAMSTANFTTGTFVTATGNQYIGGYSATLQMTGGAGVTAIDLSKDGTTYDNVWTQASGALSQTVQFHVDNADFVRVTFATTQPVVRILPDK